MRNRYTPTLVVALLLCAAMSFGFGQAKQSQPKPLRTPEPEYSDEARRQHIEGSVLLVFVVNKEGRTENVRVERGLGHGLDEKALEAVRQWRFEPATREGIAVPVEIHAEVSFHLGSSRR